MFNNEITSFQSIHKSQIKYIDYGVTYVFIYTYILSLSLCSVTQAKMFEFQMHYQHQIPVILDRKTLQSNYFPHSLLINFDDKLR